MGFHDSLAPLVVFGCDQIKFRPKKKVKIKVSQRNSVGSGEGTKAVKHDMNLISELKFLSFD